MRRALAVLLLATALGAGADEPPIPPPGGFVVDRAEALSEATRTRITRLDEELQAKTGAEIAVVTVRTTAPLDDFTYAMRIADAWKPGRRRDDTGVVFLVALDDHKVRILVGYGLEGILPDGRVGEIIDQEVVPEFKAGRIDEGVLGGVGAVARTIADWKGVTLTGVPPPRERAADGLPGWISLLLVVAFVILVLYQASRPRRLRGGGFFPPYGFGGGFGGGGFGGGGGGFGGFGGGSFGGGGAGRSW